MVGGFRGDEEPVAAAQLGELVAGSPQPRDTALEVAVYLGDDRGERLRISGEDVLDAGQRYARVREDPYLDEIDGVAGGVAPIAGRVAVGLGEQTALVVVAWATTICSPPW